MSWLLCDIGNSTIKIAMAADLESMQMVATYPTSNASEAGDRILALAADMPIALCSVVSGATQAIERVVNRPIFQVASDKQQEIKNISPGFGADRLADIVAAKRLYAKNKDFLVIGLGTATVLTAISSQAQYVGGFITLGMVSTLDAIKAKIPVLPNVEPETCTAQLACTTIESIGNGTLLAQAACVDRWIEEAKKCFEDDCVTVATGGCLEFIGKHTRSINHSDGMLTLRGTYLLAQKEGLSL